LKDPRVPPDKVLRLGLFPIQGEKLRNELKVEIILTSFTPFEEIDHSSAFSANTL